MQASHNKAYQNMENKQFKKLKERLCCPLVGCELTLEQCKELDEEIRNCIIPIFMLAGYKKT